MKEFIQLRAIARDKRDKAIAAARADYTATLVKIATLEKDLSGRSVSESRRSSAVIESMLPTDRQFDTLDVMTSLEALDPCRVWCKRSVSNHLCFLRRKGITCNKMTPNEISGFVRGPFVLKP